MCKSRLGLSQKCLMVCIQISDLSILQCALVCKLLYSRWSIYNQLIRIREINVVSFPYRQRTIIFVKSWQRGVVLVHLIPWNDATCAGFCQLLPVLIQPVQGVVQGFVPLPEQFCCILCVFSLSSDVLLFSLQLYCLFFALGSSV